MKTVCSAFCIAAAMTFVAGCGIATADRNTEREV